MSDRIFFAICVMRRINAVEKFSSDGGSSTLHTGKVSTVHYSSHPGSILLSFDRFMANLLRVTFRTPLTPNPNPILVSLVGSCELKQTPR
jgi:hypothetical protein